MITKYNNLRKAARVTHIKDLIVITAFNIISASSYHHKNNSSEPLTYSRENK